jgi:hypothetical protein
MQHCLSFEKGSGTQRVTENSVGEEWCSLERTWRCGKNILEVTE